MIFSFVGEITYASANFIFLTSIFVRNRPFNNGYRAINCVILLCKRCRTQTRRENSLSNKPHFNIVPMTFSTKSNEFTRQSILRIKMESMRWQCVLQSSLDTEKLYPQKERKFDKRAIPEDLIVPRLKGPSIPTGLLLELLIVCKQYKRREIS